VLASRGYAVVVDYLHDRRCAESTVETVLAGNSLAVAVRADVADDLDVERLFAETIEAFGGVDVLVHAVRGRAGATAVADSDLVGFEALCRINTRATFLVNREAARRLRDGGSIVNLTSSTVDTAVPTYGVDAATSAAAVALTRVLALELRERDITVNAVSLDVDRPCAPDRVAEAVVSLIGDGQGPTGEVIGVDQGRSA
jgi:3-oxoacyl-[acyl-carrier protein] reductase